MDETNFGAYKYVKSVDEQYMEMIAHVMKYGYDDIDRTGTGKRSVFSYDMRFDLQRGFPIVSAKKTNMAHIVSELVWFLAGDTNIAYLHEHGNHIWDEWARPDGSLGPVYGHQWRKWQRTKILSSAHSIETMTGGKSTVHYEAKVQVTEIDQIQNAIDTLKTNPESRRIIVSAWNVGDIQDMALPPCHSFFQFWTRNLEHWERGNLLKKKIGSLGVMEYFEPLHERGRGRGERIQAACDEHGIPTKALSCKLTQRSADTFLGVPFNIASYALLTHMVAQCVNMMPDEFVWSGGDVHIYHNHYDAVNKLLQQRAHPSPALVIKNPTTCIDDFKAEDFELDSYVHGPYIKAPVAV